jgi:UDP-N-acetylmuramoyl-tripeptide--D-alanyl-D-alanine ligase
MKSIAVLLPELTGARSVGGAAAMAALAIARVHTDTRSLQPGDLFVALRGERFDAHDFLPQARAQGAVAALAEAGLASAGLVGVEVPNSKLALGELAHLWRAQFTLPLIAVTGSNGKTTVTQMVASILRAAVGEAAHATRGNFNNDIGVPLTLLRLLPSHQMAVIELGMNHPGEIATLAAIAQPTVALVNNAQREHQEFMVSVEAVARENGAVIAALKDDGVAVFPSDEVHTPIWQELAGKRSVISFSDTDAGAAVHVQSANWKAGAWDLHFTTPMGAEHCTLRVAGRHNLRNAMAAAACALAAGVPLAAITHGLAAFEPIGGRSRALAVPLADHVLTLIDDSYNANPDSVLAAIDVLAELPAPRLLALGDMGEVGEQGLAFHLEVLRHAQARGIEAVHVAGDWMRQACDALHVSGEPVPTHWAEVDALVAHLAGVVGAAGAQAPRSVLVKGSRFMQMERVVQALQAIGPTEPDQKDAPHAA